MRGRKREGECVKARKLSENLEANEKPNMFSETWLGTQRHDIRYNVMTLDNSDHGCAEVLFILKMLLDRSHHTDE